MSADIVSCSKTITVHSLQSKQPLNSYTYHRGVINSISINHNSKVIASCGQDGKLFLVSAQKPENKLIEHSFSPNAKEKPLSLNACAFSPNSKYIAVGSVDSVIKVWDIRGDNTAKKQQNIVQIKTHMCGVTSLAWIKQLRSQQYGSQILASSSSSGQIFIHSNKTGTFSEVSAFKMQEGINCIKVSEGSDYCRLAACTNGGTLALWDLINGKDKPFWQISMPNQNKVSLTSLSISSYSPVLLVTSSMNQSLVFFDIHQKKSVKTIAADQPLNCVGLHGNGHTLVAGGMYGSLFVYDLRNPAKPQNKLGGHQTTIKHLQFLRSREKEVISTVSDNKMSTNGQALLQQKPSSTLNIIAAQSKNKEGLKVPDPKMYNVSTVSSATQGMVSPAVSIVPVKKQLAVQDLSRDKKIEPKLSAVGQEVIRSNNSVKAESLSRFSGPSEHESYRNRQLSNIQLGGPSASRQAQLRQLRELREKLHSMQGSLKQVKSQMYQMQERLNMSMIRQFQIQHNQIKHLIQSSASREREKDERIKLLQAELYRLKHSTF